MTVSRGIECPTLCVKVCRQFHLPQRPTPNLETNLMLHLWELHYPCVLQVQTLIILSSYDAGQRSSTNGSMPPDVIISSTQCHSEITLLPQPLYSHIIWPCRGTIMRPRVTGHRPPRPHLTTPTLCRQVLLRRPKVLVTITSRRLSGRAVNGRLVWSMHR